MPIESPKARFLKSPQAKVLVDFATNKDVIAILDAALNQMQWDIGNAQDMGMAAANQFRMEGARRFVTTFLTLADAPKPAARDRGDNLSEV